jgi:hypothetical protein
LVSAGQSFFVLVSGLHPPANAFTVEMHATSFFCTQYHAMDQETIRIDPMPNSMDDLVTFDILFRLDGAIAHHVTGMYWNDAAPHEPLQADINNSITSKKSESS